LLQSHSDKIPKKPIEGRHPKQKQKSERKANETKQTTNNHNDCFIEEHNKILKEEQAANNSINRIPIIRVFAVRVTPIFTSKTHALNT
jgi:hypothetical protein